MPTSMSVETIYHFTQDDVYVRAEVPSHLVGFRIPRSFASSLSTESELKQAGIYILASPEARTAYIGQAVVRENGNGILSRMLETHSKAAIDNWSVGFALTTGSPHFFGATELNWLERDFYDLAGGSGYTLLNGNRPQAMDPGVFKRKQLEDFLDYALLVLSNELNCDVFEQTTEASPEPTGPVTAYTGTLGEEMYHLTARGADAQGCFVEDGSFVVLQGSKLSADTTNSFVTLPVSKKRTALLESGLVADGVLTTAVAFNSQYAAACVIAGASLNGRAAWGTELVPEPDNLPADAAFDDAPDNLPPDAGFDTAPDSVPIDVSSDRVYYHLTSRGSDAIGYYEGKNFIVCKESRMSPDVTESFKKKKLYAVRQRLEQDGFMLKEDVSFSSISAAASVIAGHGLDGREKWKKQTPPTSSVE